MTWKGIILAGGSGTRLYPSTLSISKQLIPIYDKPMIFYSLSILMYAEIREILIITTPRDLKSFKSLLGNGKDLGVSIKYKIQENPKGLPDAFIVGENFIGKENVCLVLGDNFFYGQGFKEYLLNAKARLKGATVFGYKVNNPSEFGIIEVNKNGSVISIKEKPKNPRSNMAIPGLYFFDNQSIKKSKTLKPSGRGELEITALLKSYLNENQLVMDEFGRGFAWLDTGSHSSLLEASHFVEMIEKRQGLKIACLEEIAWRNGWITKKNLLDSAKKYSKSSYGEYLIKIANE